MTNTTNTIRNASTVDVAIHSESVTYRAELIGDRVTVSRRNDSGGWELAGHGDWTGERVDNCPADLGDEAWDAIDAALIELMASTGHDVHCECGRATGERCAWDGPKSETVIVEWMPDHLRASHAAAHNRGAYPSNGAIRLRAERSCAQSLVDSEGGWAEIVE